jgi:glycerophosphoryl diester phosphodiesterase
MKIYAHRGSSGENPEMTMVAYLAAIADGADGFECDVRLTKNLEIACIHDSNTKRVSTSNLSVRKSTLLELRQVASVISLEELISLAITARKDLLIESKHPVFSGGAIERKVVNLLDDMAEEISQSGIEIVCMSFSWFAVERLRKHKRSCNVAKYYFQAILSQTTNVALGISLIKRHPKLVSKLKKRGKRVLVWTVNKESEFELCKELGVDAVITNYPKVARNYG